jgi:MerR family mercuric resistance operon transcriptional regulator
LRPAGEISIGELSRRTRCNVETIRYYERIAILPRPRRPGGGRFRRYDDADVARLAFIRRARQLGFTLDEIRDLLRLAAAAGSGEACAEARAVATAHVEEIRAKIADLHAMERVLSDAVRRCDAGEASRCPIIETLAAG